MSEETKTDFRGIIAVVILGVVTASVVFLPASEATHPKIEVWFSPKGGCAAAIIKGIDEAKTTIHFSAYEFTRDDIRDALIRAAKRGVKVALVVDHRAHASRHEDADAVLAAGGTVSVDAKHNIHHNKIVVIDAKIVFTGSFNFSDNAELHNAENLVRIEDVMLARKYVENFAVHRGHGDMSEKP